MFFLFGANFPEQGPQTFGRLYLFLATYSHIPQGNELASHLRFHPVYYRDCCTSGSVRVQEVPLSLARILFCSWISLQTEELEYFYGVDLTLR